MLEFLEGLPDEARQAVERAWRPRTLRAGEVLYRPEDEADELHVVVSGRVRLYRMGENAREVSLAVCSHGEICGENTLTRALRGEHGLRHGCTAEAMGPTSTHAIGFGLLSHLLAEHPTLTVAISAQLARQLRDTNARLSESVFLEVSQRLARTLLGLAAAGDAEPVPGGTRLNGNVSHQDLAHLVGSTRETITKILGEFRAAGLLDLGYRRITLTDLPGLRATAERGSS